MKAGLFIILLLMAAVAIFEFHPSVERGRNIIPEEVYVGKECRCECISDSRPWYSTFNYWQWLWILIVPLLVFSLKKDAPKWKRIGAGLVAVGLCYFFMNLSMHLFWDIKNGSFTVDFNPDFPLQKTWDMPCADIRDGASLVFTLFLGWIPASLYVGFWFMTSYFFNKVLKQKRS